MSDEEKRFALSGNAENVDWEDIAETGRAYADNLIGEPGISELMHRMADEIELLRGYRDAAESDASIAQLVIDKLRLTDDEREALEWFAEVHKPLARLTKSNKREQYIAALCDLLERTNAAGK